MSEVQYKNILTKGYLSALNNTPIEDDTIRFTKDTNQMFVDFDGERKEISDFIKEFSEAEIKAILAPLPKLYLSKDTNKLFRHNGEEWVIVAEKNLDKVQSAFQADNATNADNATHATTADSATSAMNDADGNQINTTYAPLDSPIFTGAPVAPTPASGDNSKKLANTEYVIAAIAEAVGSITKFNTEVVESLPATGVKGTIYFIDASTAEEGNVYDEYIWLDTKYERIGNTKINLDGYVNDTEVSGTGNAITGATINGNKLVLEKGATFLTKHPSVTSTPTTSTDTPTAGSTIEMITSIEVDENGHITKYNTETVTLPNSVTSATKASQDDSGQSIKGTYVKAASSTGKVITFTRGDGTTFTINTQDTTYAAMQGATATTAGKAGLVPAPASGVTDKYLKSDGTWGDIKAGEGDYDFGDLDDEA